MKLRLRDQKENIVYLLLWLVLFLAPVINMLVGSYIGNRTGVDWHQVLHLWRTYLVYFMIFLIHNFLLLPILVVGHKRMTYFCIVALVVSLFAIHQCSSSPTPPDRHPKPELGMQHHPGPPPGEFRPDAPPPFIGEQDILALLVLILMFGANIGIKGYFRSRRKSVNR
jgi:hypothetical protein